MADTDKRKYRQIKKAVKRKGNKRRRNYLKRDVLNNPEEAHIVGEFDFGESSSKVYNKIDEKLNFNWSVDNVTGEEEIRECGGNGEGSIKS